MATSAASIHRPSRGLHVALWVAQALLGVAFVLVGFMKLTASADATMGMPIALVRFIGAAEVAGGLGVLLPSALRIRPSLTPLAAWGLVVVMVLAAGFHMSRGEWSSVPTNVVLGALAAFVAWGRTRPAPIAPRA